MSSHWPSWWLKIRRTIVFFFNWIIKVYCWRLSHFAIYPAGLELFDQFHLLCSLPIFKFGCFHLLSLVQPAQSHLISANEPSKMRCQNWRHCPVIISDLVSVSQSITFLITPIDCCQCQFILWEELSGRNQPIHLQGGTSARRNLSETNY